ncbi:MAG: zinc-dependent metalloprotease family protein [Phycisphaerae bacterium]
MVQAGKRDVARQRYGTSAGRQVAPAVLFVIAMVVWMTVGIVRAQVPDRSVAPAERGDAIRTAQVLERMDLSDATLTRLEVSERADGEGLRVTVPINGQARTLHLVPWSVRAAGFTVKAQLADGSYVDVGAPPARTYRGTVEGVGGGVVAASLTDDGLLARIILPDNTQVWVEPLASRVDFAMPGEHVVYRGADVKPSGGGCLVVREDGEVVQDSPHADPGGSTANAAGGAFIAELAVDADFEFFQAFGTIDATVARIESVVATMNLQYIRDVSVRHDISTIIVRTTQSDPYSSTNPNTLLGQLRTHWRNAQGGVQRDVTQLFTGKNIDGGVIGIAWLSAICSSNFGYGVVQSSCCGSFACATDLSAHELGHNWSAGHCSCSGWTMNPFITCANRFIATSSIPSIINHRNSRVCLDVTAGFPCPASNSPTAESTVTIKNRYLTFSGANPGQTTAIRVTAVALPPPYDVFNGTTLWVDDPVEVSENPATIAPAGAPGAATFLAAPLRCDPLFLDWNARGMLHARHRLLVPDGIYEVQEINGICAIADEAAYSAPLVVSTGQYGDLVQSCETAPCTPPDGSVDFTSDVIAILDKFKGSALAAGKARVDLQPETPDLIIDMSDLLLGVDAFRGRPFPFPPPVGPLCP